MDSGERELIHTALAGDADSFELLMHAFGLRVYAVAYAILQDRSEAEDCAQDAFFKAWRGRGGIREPEKFPAWLLTITRHAARDRLRRRAARPATVPLVSPDDLLAAGGMAGGSGHGAAAAASPDDEEDEAERRGRVHELLSTLPERHRIALSLRYLEGLDHRAIEEAMELSNGALRGILARALETMRRGLRTMAAAAASAPRVTSSPSASVPAGRVPSASRQPI